MASVTQNTCSRIYHRSAHPRCFFLTSIASFQKPLAPSAKTYNSLFRCPGLPTIIPPHDCTRTSACSACSAAALPQESRPPNGSNTHNIPNTLHISKRNAGRQACFLSIHASIRGQLRPQHAACGIPNSTGQSPGTGDLSEIKIPHTHIHIKTAPRRPGEKKKKKQYVREKGGEKRKHPAKPKRKKSS